MCKPACHVDVSVSVACMHNHVQGVEFVLMLFGRRLTVVPAFVVLGSILLI